MSAGAVTTRKLVMLPFRENLQSTDREPIAKNLVFCRLFSWRMVVAVGVLRYSPCFVTSVERYASCGP